MANVMVVVYLLSMRARVCKSERWVYSPRYYCVRCIFVTIDITSFSFFIFVPTHDPLVIVARACNIPATQIFRDTIVPMASMMGGRPRGPHLRTLVPTRAVEVHGCATATSVAWTCWFPAPLRR